MNNALPRTVIETIVRKAIIDIQDAPKRSTRNLIDMALTVVEGRFQSRFFQIAQTMLKNENSSYYKLIPDVVASVDADKIVTFGLNLGYNSCTVGAKRIREYEKQKHFNIPWSITLAISGKAYMEKEESYRSVLKQGKELGVYTWMIYAMDGADHILSLVAHEPECAFVIYCDPEEITEVMLDEAKGINEVMFVVHKTDGVEEACRLLRSRHFLYSVFYTYNDSDLNSIISGEHLSNIESLHPAFTAFLAEPDCTEKTQKEVYQYVTEIRKSQKYPTILWDVVSDSRFVDSIISEDSCSAGFDTQGYLCTFQGQLQRLEYNVFQQPLENILKRAFPKSTVPISPALA